MSTIKNKRQSNLTKQYNKLVMNMGNDTRENIIGRENQFMYATEEQRKLFYSKMINLSKDI